MDHDSLIQACIMLELGGVDPTTVSEVIYEQALAWCRTQLGL